MLKIGRCGDDCNFCPRYLATLSGDEQRLGEVAEMWLIPGWRDTNIGPVAMICYGCDMVRICGLGIKECVIGKGLDNCGECTEYPCEKLAKFLKNNEKEAVICEEKLSPYDFELFNKAFFTKKDRLDKINRGDQL